MDIHISPQQIETFNEVGFVVIEDLIDREHVERYRELYDRFIYGDIDAGKNRSDLGGHSERNRAEVENVTQIMWPSDFVPGLLEGVYHQRALSVARLLLGDDMAFDFDMLIDKAPYTNTPTPWHQDASYWIDLPDTRAASCWLALDDATVDNGCMWFIPGSHRLPLRSHRTAGAGGGALECDACEAEAMAVPLRPGSCTFHAGGTLHYSRGNSTDTRRRAFITNFRPQAMIELERAQNFDHGRTINDRTVRNVQAQGTQGATAQEQAPR